MDSLLQNLQAHGTLEHEVELKHNWGEGGEGGGGERGWGWESNGIGGGGERGVGGGRVLE